MSLLVSVCSCVTGCARQDFQGNDHEQSLEQQQQHHGEGDGGRCGIVSVEGRETCFLGSSAFSVTGVALRGSDCCRDKGRLAEIEKIHLCSYIELNAGGLDCFIQGTLSRSLFRSIIQR